MAWLHTYDDSYSEVFFHGLSLHYSFFCSSGWVFIIIGSLFVLSGFVITSLTASYATGCCNFHWGSNESSSDTATSPGDSS